MGSGPSFCRSNAASSGVARGTPTFLVSRVPRGLGGTSDAAAGSVARGTPNSAAIRRRFRGLLDALLSGLRGCVGTTCVFGGLWECPPGGTISVRLNLPKMLCDNGLEFGHGGCILTCRHFEVGCWGWWIAESNGRVDDETRGGGIYGDDAGPSGLRG